MRPEFVRSAQWLCLGLAVAMVPWLQSCGADRPPAAQASRAAEAWDTANRPAPFGLKPLRYEQLIAPGTARGAVADRPWKDNYWPYHRKNLAYRYTTAVDFATFADQIADATADASAAHLSPAEKYDLLTGDAAFSLTRESWSLYDHYRQKYGDDLGKWSWMGICAGWAPAAIAESPPVSAVATTSPSGRPLLFYPGDLRALLSKAYDLNKTTAGYRMIGSRCNEPEYAVPRDHQGRPIDGRLTASLEPFFILADHSRAPGALEVTRDPLHPSPYWLLAAAPVSGLSGTMPMWRYKDRAQLAADLLANTRGAHAESQDPVEVQFYKSCRDVNPAALHTALIEGLAESAPTRQSFVVELSRDREVWNHPVWGYTTSLGAPRPVAGEPPERRVFRAPGTTHVVDVDTVLIYVNGAAPQAAYLGDAGGALDWRDFAARPWTYPTLTLGYTLELDASGLVIGGEWNESADARLALPDFFWRTYGQVTDELKAGGPSPLRYSLLQQLVACGRRAPDTHVPQPGGGDVAAVLCPLLP